MTEKIKSEITRIDLTDASYKGTNTFIEPTYVNFFFGNNGSGKSTIAKNIRDGIGITYAPGRSAEDYLTLVFNQAFIDEHLKSYRNMQGVFTLNAKNDEAQKKIDAKNEERNEENRLKKIASDECERQRKLKEDIEKIFHEECWKRSKAIRDEFTESSAGKNRSKKLLAINIFKEAPKDVDIDELRRLYAAAFTSTARKYSLFNTIEDVNALDELEGKEILNAVIVNSADTELATFLRKIGATEWMQQGHTAYTECADGQCPYCGRQLPEDFEETITKSFDAQYQANLQLLNSFLESYRSTANAFFVPLEKIPDTIYPPIKVKIYTEKLSILKALIQSNIEAIREKISEPAKIVQLSDTAPILTEISEILSEFNRLINENNTIVDAGAVKKIECNDMIYALLSFQLQDIYGVFTAKMFEMDEEIKKLEEEVKSRSDNIEKIKEDIKSLSGQTVETDTAKDSINLMLRDSGMQGFSLQPKSGVEHVYEVRRPDGTIAENLSEGEKNFIAFLYFYHLVCGSTSEDGDTREKIVVIDDPVSSMDSGSLFIVSTLVKQLIEICRNNADNRNKVVDGNFIKQIFVLTHNSYFHREITYGYVSRYEYVSFYLIRKLDTKSYIKLSDKVDPISPTERININPVKNSYAALWDEYKEVQSAIPLVNVIRRILEYYFLQICGYDGSNLRQVILVDGKNNGKFKDENGNDDIEKYQLAAAMLAYINANTTGMNEGIEYVDETLNPDECRKIFEMIFDEMHQKQHYDMMMGNH